MIDCGYIDKVLLAGLGMSAEFRLTVTCKSVYSLAWQAGLKAYDGSCDDSIEWKLLTPSAQTEEFDEAWLFL
jgi:hypothetical protein